MLTSEQRQKLTDEAKRRGIDPDELIAAAETGPKRNADDQAGGGSDQPKLFMYLLPFVTVREVRQVWLGLTDSFSGDNEVASKWAAKQGGDSAPAAPDVVE